MTGTNAELIEAARQRRLPIESAVGIEDVAYDGGWGSLLAASAADVPLLLNALEAATLTATEDALYVKRMEAERDAALAVIEEVRSLNSGEYVDSGDDEERFIAVRMVLAGAAK